MKQINYLIISLLFCILYSCGNNASKSNSDYIDLDSLAAANEAKENGIWNINYYIDDFGETTDESFVIGLVTDGKFSNSATEGSDLSVRILVDSDNVRLRLYEYSQNNPIKDEGTLHLKIKDDNNNIKEFGFDVSKEGYCNIEEYLEGTAEEFLDLLMKNKKLRCVGETNKYGSLSIYHFEINTKGFKKLYKKL